jgi:hypothetical protein
MKRIFQSLLLVACASGACAPPPEEAPVPDHLPVRTMVEGLAPTAAGRGSMMPIAADLEVRQQRLSQVFYSPWDSTVPVNVLFFRSPYSQAHYVLYQRKSDNRCILTRVADGPLTGSVSIHGSDADDYLESIVTGYTGMVGSCSNMQPFEVTSADQFDPVHHNTWVVGLSGDGGNDYMTCGGDRTYCNGWTGDDTINVYHATSRGHGDQGSDKLTAWADGLELFGDWEGNPPYGGDCIQTNNFSLWGYNCGPGVDRVQGGAAGIGSCETVVPSCY